MIGKVVALDRAFSVGKRLVVFWGFAIFFSGHFSLMGEEKSLSPVEEENEETVSGPDGKPSKGAPPVADLNFKQPEKTGKNLVPNFDLEKSRHSQVKGETVPEGWIQNSPKGDHDFDGISVFFREIERNGKKTRLIECDTDVLEKEALERDEAMMKKTEEPAPPKTPVKESQKYATLGGAYGVRVWTDKGIPVEKGAYYVISCDVKGPSSGKIFIKGYGKGDYERLNEKLESEKAENMAGERGVLYSTYLQAHGEFKSGEWNRISKVFNPTIRSPNVDEVKIQIFAYWPGGPYFYDNFEIRLATEAEVKAHLEEQEKIREALREQKEKDRQKSGNAPRRGIPLEEVKEEK